MKKEKKKRTWGNEGWKRIIKDKDDTCNWQEIKKSERIPQVKIVREQTISIESLVTSGNIYTKPLSQGEEHVYINIRCNMHSEGITHLNANLKQIN